MFQQPNMDHPQFRTERPSARGSMLSMRLSDEQNETLERLAERLDLSKAEVLRTALDYWIENSEDARRAMRRR